MILAGGSISNSEYVPQNYQIFLLTTLIMLVHGCISSMPTKWIAQFNSYGSSFNIIALCIVLILIPSNTNREAQGLPKFTPASVVIGNINDILKKIELPFLLQAMLTSNSIQGQISHEESRFS